MKLKWPLVWRSTYDDIKRQNSEFKNALRNANEELRKHRLIIADLRNGDFDVMERLGKKKAPGSPGSRG